MLENNGWDKTKEWFWEGNIQNKIVEYMQNVEHFTRIKVADTLRKEPGPDIKAERKLEDGSVEIRQVAVKGYPSRYYTQGEKKGQVKRTSRSTQARHWFAEAIMELILTKSQDESIQIALGIPDFRVYRKLLNRIKWFREKIGLFCYLVGEKGEVKLLKPEENI